MTKEITKSTPNNSVQTLMSRPDVQQKFQALLGKKAQGFITSILQVVASNELLKNADPMSIYGAAAMAATLDLPINNNLGFAYIIPYYDKKTGKQAAQFQIGYKGLIQLAMRSQQLKNLSSAAIYEGQIKSHNPLTGFQFDWENKTSNKIIGYAASFQLLNGFEKILYMSVEDLQDHGKRYSQTYKKGFGLWVDNFDAMAHKTVLKLLIGKYAPMEIQKFIEKDDVVAEVDPKTLEVEDKVIDADSEVVNVDDISFSDEEKAAADKNQKLL